jgi:peroxiredoxin
MAKRVKGGGFLVISLLLVCFLFSPFSSAHGGLDDLFLKLKIRSLTDGRKAPNFSLDGLSGRRVELKQFKGKVVVLSFWATWCGPCKEELPSIEALHRQFKGKDLAVLTVSVDYEGTVPVEKYIAKQGYTFYVLVDAKGSLLDLYGVELIPTTILIDKKGRLIGKALGPRDWASPEAISLFNQLIEKIEK